MGPGTARDRTSSNISPSYRSSGYGSSAYTSEDGQEYRLVHNVAFEDAMVKAKPSPFTKRMFMLYYCLAVATVNSVINGYDTSLMGAINSYEQYRDYFGFDPIKGTPTTGIVYAIYTIGNIVGSFFAGPASDIRGRKWGMFTGAAIIIVGTCVQATCSNLGGFIGGRFVLGFGLAICAAAGPAYTSEMSHPAYRGVMTGIFNSCWFVGGIPGTFVPYATSYIDSSMSWRLPVWFQLVGAGIVCCLAPFLPETPRWLIANDRHEEALAVMTKYHGEGDRNSPIVQLEYREMVEDISVTGSDKRWWDYRELINSREVRYRSFLVVAMAFFTQWIGNGPVSYYYPQMLATAGITNNKTRLLLNGVQNVVSFSGALFGAAFTDKWGRRPQLLVSTGIIICIFATICALNATNVTTRSNTIVAKNQSQAKAMIAIIFIFGFVYSAGHTPLQALYPVECLRYESRAKGMGMYNFFVNIAGFYNTFATGIAFTRAGWKYYFLFIFWDIFEFVIIYFFFVETKARTLEELTEIFRANKPVQASKGMTQVVLNDKDGTNGVTEVLDKGTEFQRLGRRGDEFF
ncbi:general substrate transporter [Patellaria atrata CBS 101060]|uniref:General substrate transporter n=1 Tax=Patellaria atrata CBS 101060 TaxID=1346257 RepID=A0A9P4VLX9_9PEZI|nr:general substrate transporter [Patellaria atrata CBS 101060]